MEKFRSNPAQFNVDVLGTRLQRLLSKTNAKITELKTLVEQESELTGVSCFHTITPLLTKQEDLKRGISAIINSLETRSVHGTLQPSTSTNSTNRERSLTVTMRDFETRRRAAKEQSTPSTSSSQQDLHAVSKVERVPSFVSTAPTRRSGSLDCLQQEPIPTIAGSNAGRFRIQKIRTPETISDKSQLLNSANTSTSAITSSPPLPFRFNGSVDATIDETPPSVMLDKGHQSRLYPVTLSGAQRYTPVPPSVNPKGSTDDYDNWKCLVTGNEKEAKPISTQNQNSLGKSASGGPYGIRPIDRTPSLQKISLKNALPDLSSIQLRSFLYYQNEISKPFETEDVEKYSVKRNSKRHGYGAGSSQLSPSVSSVHSDCSSGLEDTQSLRNGSSYLPLKELHGNMELSDELSTTKTDRTLNNGDVQDMSSPFQEELSYDENPSNYGTSSSPSPDDRELRRRVKMFRFGKGEFYDNPSLAIQQLDDTELNMLLEVLAYEPKLLTPEESDYLLNEYHERQFQPTPRLPPKGMLRDQHASAEAKETEFDETDGEAWGPVRPTIV